MLLCIWSLAIAVYIFTIIFKLDQVVAIIETVLYALLGIQLLIINCVLLNKVNQLTPTGSKDKFKSEKRFLIATLIFFSLSYLTSLVRNGIIYTILKTSNNDRDNDNRLYDFFCVDTLRLTIFNIGTFTLTELIPYQIIFCLNYHNFKDMPKADEYMKRQ